MKHSCAHGGTKFFSSLDSVMFAALACVDNANIKRRLDQHNAILIAVMSKCQQVEQVASKGKKLVEKPP